VCVQLIVTKEAFAAELAQWVDATFDLFDGN
jgi:hypothetical protein